MAKKVQFDKAKALETLKKLVELKAQYDKARVEYDVVREEYIDQEDRVIQLMKKHQIESFVYQGCRYCSVCGEVIEEKVERDNDVKLD